MTKTTVLNQQIALLRGNRIVRVLLNATDMMVLLMNGDRRILYASDAFCRMVGVADDTFLLGQRIGNAWHCIWADDAPESCGGSEACRHCEVYNTLARAIHDHESRTAEASVVHLEGEVARSLNLMTHVVPAALFGVDCFIVTLVDISDTLHRRWFEQIFYHDLLNKLGALENYVTLMARDLPEAYRDDMSFVQESFRTVVEDIKYQKQVSEAETGELQVAPITLRAGELVAQVARLFQQYAGTRGMLLEVVPPAVEVTVFTDFLLLRRVLENMVKNALEASVSGDVVRIGADAGDGARCAVTFWVWNAAYIPPEVQPHIFERAFSTKGHNRGMGTYSMKLIGERGLKGNVGFETSREAGTRFQICLPAVQPEQMEGVEA